MVSRQTGKLGTKLIAVIFCALTCLSACDDTPTAPLPDRDQLYQLFERVADFTTALDRLDIVCGSTGDEDKLGWLRMQSAAWLDSDQQAKLEAFIKDHRQAVFETYKGKYCGMEVVAERDNYVAAYKVHRLRLQNALNNLRKAGKGRP